jgi:hypothetical protein
VIESLKEAGEDLFTFLRFPSSQWKALRTTDEIDKSFFSCTFLFRRRQSASRHTAAEQAPTMSGACAGGPSKRGPVSEIRPVRGYG